MAVMVKQPRRSGMATPLLIVGAALLVAGATYVATWTAAPSEPPVATTVQPAAGAEAVSAPGGGDVADADLARIDEAVAVWAGNVERDAADFISATNLASLYLQRGRVTGDAADHARGLEAVELALEAYPEATAARIVRAELLFATHDFTAARDEATGILAIAPDEPQALATLGDAALELGDYEAAGEAYASLAAVVDGAAVNARLAHLAWLQGDDAEGIRLSAEGASMARSESASASERAWYEFFAGELLFRTGDPGAAEARFRAAIELDAGSHQAHAGLARVLAAAGDIDGAIASYSEAVAIFPEPSSLAALGDLHRYAGRADLAAQQDRAVEAMGELAAADGGLYGRQLTLYWSDHGRHVDRAVNAARAELEDRTDIYGWDAYAWALLAAGRAQDADAAMASALELGTTDATLDYHAGIIAAAVGDHARARDHLDAALASRTLPPLDAERARATLEGLAP